MVIRLELLPARRGPRSGALQLTVPHEPPCPQVTPREGAAWLTTAGDSSARRLRSTHQASPQRCCQLRPGNRP